MQKENEPIVNPSSEPTYAIFRLMLNGWGLVRTNLPSRKVAESLFRNMKAEDPKIKLRILELRETVIHEE